MKIFVGAMTLALSFGALASSIQTRTFVYDGSRNSVELVLRGEKTHTEYRYEDHRTTCPRTEIVGYSTVCTGGGGYYPAPGPYPHPYPGPGPGYRQCYQQPIYRTVYYPCTQTISIPYEVKDYDVEARVIVDVTKVSPEATAGETFKVTLNGDMLVFDAVGSKKFFIVNKKQSIRSNMNGSVKMIDALLAAELIEAAPVLKAIKVSDLVVKDSVLNFSVGEAETRANLGLALKVEKKKLLGSDSVLIDRALTDSEVSVNGTLASVDMNGLGVTFDGGKYELTAKTFVKVNGSLMNSSQFGNALEATKTLIYKIR